MEQKKVKVTKDGIIKLVLEKDVADFILAGWKKVDEKSNIFGSTFDFKK